MANTYKLARFIIRIIFRIRNFQKRELNKFAENIRNKLILEIGSGKIEKKKYFYSFSDSFDKSNKFIKSDVNPNFGHKIINIETMNIENKYDVILCLNVLEHVYNFSGSISNLHRALKKNGVLIVSVPYMYPLHDEPGDFWRFTEHSLKKLFYKFEVLKKSHLGLKEFPIAYYFELRKK